MFIISIRSQNCQALSASMVCIGLQTKDIEMMNWKEPSDPGQKDLGSGFTERAPAKQG